jgi:hypothetical protein
MTTDAAARPAARSTSQMPLSFKEDIATISRPRSHSARSHREGFRDIAVQGVEVLVRIIVQSQLRAFPGDVGLLGGRSLADPGEGVRPEMWRGRGRRASPAPPVRLRRLRRRARPRAPPRGEGDGPRNRHSQRSAQGRASRSAWSPTRSVSRSPFTNRSTVHSESTNVLPTVAAGKRLALINWCTY